jgi:hypothetical protein
MFLIGIFYMALAAPMLLIGVLLCIGFVLPLCAGPYYNCKNSAATLIYGLCCLPAFILGLIIGSLVGVLSFVILIIPFLLVGILMIFKSCNLYAKFNICRPFRRIY